MGKKKDWRAWFKEKLGGADSGCGECAGGGTDVAGRLFGLASKHAHTTAQGLHLLL